MSGAEDRELMRQHKANGTLEEYCKSYYAGTPAPELGLGITNDLGLSPPPTKDELKRME